ncbi:hypothetical protein [Sorangium sp. So ce1000]|uniref:hypothetical protein n=1 Tax=Sorangium sp. So ce1000 TaxID=3133325 RepID=UPI003F607987
MSAHPGGVGACWPSTPSAAPAPPGDRRALCSRFTRRVAHRRVLEAAGLLQRGARAQRRYRIERATLEIVVDWGAWFNQSAAPRGPRADRRAGHSRPNVSK